MLHLARCYCRRGDNYYKQTTYWVFLNILRKYLGLSHNIHKHAIYYCLSESFQKLFEIIVEDFILHKILYI